MLADQGPNPSSEMSSLWVWVLRQVTFNLCESLFVL